MPRETDQVTVLEAVLLRLKDRMPDVFTDKTLFLTAAPPDEPPENVRDNLFATVSPINGSFDQGVHVGAGIHGTIEETGVIVVVFNAIKLDRVQHDAEMLTNSARGLLSLKRRILAALSGHDLLDDDDEPLLANLMAPLQSQAPRSMWQDGKRPRSVGDLALAFSTDFLWSLDGVDDPP